MVGAGIRKPIAELNEVGPYSISKDREKFAQVCFVQTSAHNEPSSYTSGLDTIWHNINYQLECWQDLEPLSYGEFQANLHE